MSKKLGQAVAGGLVAGAAADLTGLVKKAVFGIAEKGARLVNSSGLPLPTALKNKPLRRNLHFIMTLSDETPLVGSTNDCGILRCYDERGNLITSGNGRINSHTDAALWGRVSTFMNHTFRIFGRRFMSLRDCTNGGALTVACIHDSSTYGGYATTAAFTFSESNMYAFRISEINPMRVTMSLMAYNADVGSAHDVAIGVIPLTDADADDWAVGAATQSNDPSGKPYPGVRQFRLKIQEYRNETFVLIIPPGYQLLLPFLRVLDSDLHCQITQLSIEELV